MDIGLVGPTQQQIQQRALREAPKPTTFAITEVPVNTGDVVQFSGKSFEM